VLVVVAALACALPAEAAVVDDEAVSDTDASEADERAPPEVDEERARDAPPADDAVVEESTDWSTYVIGGLTTVAVLVPIHFVLLPCAPLFWGGEAALMAGVASDFALWPTLLAGLTAMSVGGAALTTSIALGFLASMGTTSALASAGQSSSPAQRESAGQIAQAAAQAAFLASMLVGAAATGGATAGAYALGSWLSEDDGQTGE
jgi:hypothetical protein